MYVYSVTENYRDSLQYDKSMVYFKSTYTIKVFLDSIPFSSEADSLVPNYEKM